MSGAGFVYTRLCVSEWDELPSDEEDAAVKEDESKCDHLFLPAVILGQPIGYYGILLNIFRFYTCIAPIHNSRGLSKVTYTPNDSSYQCSQVQFIIQI